jgi:Subtilase family/Domain of unknown function (DUF4114)/LysM domain/LGFP repeat
MLESNSLLGENFALNSNLDTTAAKNPDPLHSSYDPFMTAFPGHSSTDRTQISPQILTPEPTLPTAKAQSSNLSDRDLDRLIQSEFNENSAAHLIFDDRYYLAQNSDVAAAVSRDEITGLEHFVKYGVDEGRAASEMFDVRYYLANNPDLQQADFNYRQALEHFLIHGWQEGRSGSLAPQPLIGIIDTGLSANHADLNYSRIQLGKDRVDGDDNPLLSPDEGSEHGTHILGIIGATQGNGIGIDGMNDEAPLWVGRAIDSGQWAQSLMEFVDVAKQSKQPNAIANLSLDLTQIDSEGNINTRYELTPSEREALEYARQNGVLVVVSAGNDGDVMSALGQASQEFDNIITVGAAEGQNRADYSSYGDGLDILTEGGTLLNPVQSLVGDSVSSMAGTSVAAAKISGAASLVWKANPGLNYRQVIDLLKSTATDLNTPGWDAQTGNGLLNLETAVAAAKTTTPVAYTPVLLSIATTWEGQGELTPAERATADRFKGKSYDWVPYTVKAGDTLSEIAIRTMGEGSQPYYDFIAQHNKIANPDLIYVGQKIEIPKVVINPQKTPCDVDPLSKMQIESGYFTVGNTGQVGIDYLLDGGEYEGELAIFSLEGMEQYTPGSTEFIKNAALRSLSNSPQGYVVVSDLSQGAKFNEVPDTKFNQGSYQGVKTFEMKPGDKFGMMLVPNGTVREVSENPTIEDDKRPLFSLVSTTPERGLLWGQIVDVNDAGNTFAMEDLRFDRTSDKDYNDIIVQITGATGEAPSLEAAIDPKLDWRDTDWGKQLLASVQSKPEESQLPSQSITIENYTVDGKFYPVFQSAQNQLGKPISEDIRFSEDVSYQLFEKGSIVSSEHGTFPLYGAIRQQYLKMGGLEGSLGAPTSGEKQQGNGTIKQTFENGYIIWNGDRAVTYSQGNGQQASTASPVSPLDLPPDRNIEFGTYQPKSQYVTPEFLNKVAAIGQRLGVAPEYLMAVMAFETGQSYSPKIRNNASGATGLIQFIPSTAKGLGTSTAALANMSAIEQLDYVEKYFSPYKDRLKTLEDVYMAVLWPKAVGKNNNYHLFAQPGQAYAQNKGLDLNDDGVVTKQEAASKVRKFLPEPKLFDREDVPEKPMNLKPDCEPSDGKDDPEKPGNPNPNPGDKPSDSGKDDPEKPGNPNPEDRPDRGNQPVPIKTLSKELDFALTDQSLWGGGQTADLGFSFSAGPKFDKEFSLGFLGKGTAKGEAGFKFEAFLSPGTFDVDFPALFDISYAGEAKPGGSVAVNFKSNLGSEGSLKTELGASALAEVNFKLEAGIKDIPILGSLSAKVELGGKIDFLNDIANGKLNEYLQYKFPQIGKFLGESPISLDLGLAASADKIKNNELKAEDTAFQAIKVVPLLSLIPYTKAVGEPLEQLGVDIKVGGNIKQDSVLKIKGFEIDLDGKKNGNELQLGSNDSGTLNIDIPESFTAGESYKVTPTVKPIVEFSTGLGLTGKVEAGFDFKEVLLEKFGNKLPGNVKKKLEDFVKNQVEDNPLIKVPLAVSASAETPAAPLVSKTFDPFSVAKFEAKLPELSVKVA